MRNWISLGTWICCRSNRRAWSCMQNVSWTTSTSSALKKSLSLVWHSAFFPVFPDCVVGHIVVYFIRESIYVQIYEISFGVQWEPPPLVVSSTLLAKYFITSMRCTDYLRSQGGIYATAAKFEYIQGPLSWREWLRTVQTLSWVSEGGGDEGQREGGSGGDLVILRRSWRRRRVCSFRGEGSYRWR